MNLRCCWLLLLVGSVLPASTRACTIPVFRYALEHWRPSPYEVVVFHNGKLTAEQAQLLSQLEQDFSATANFAIKTVDLDGTVDKDRLLLWERQQTDTKVPWVVLRYPEGDDKKDVWAGPLDAERLRLGLDSASRQKIVTELGCGASAVFVLLESGNAAADEDAAQLLIKGLPQLEKDVSLPKQDPDISPLRSELPLKVSFPTLRLSRKDAAEQPFLQMLLRSEPGLDGVQGPIVFPIYGRGRLLCALHGEDLSDLRLGDVARFLCAACSCRVKELNPGIDLLLVADWEKILDQPAITEKPPPSSAMGREEEPPKPPEAVEPWMAPPVPSVASSGPDQQHWLWLAVGGAAVLVVVTGAWALLTLTRSRTTNQPL